MFLRVWGAPGGQKYVFLHVWGAPGDQKYVVLRVWGALGGQKYVFLRIWGAPGVKCMCFYVFGELTSPLVLGGRPLPYFGGVLRVRGTRGGTKCFSL